MAPSKNILITGGAGFIGSHVVRRFVKKYSGYKIYNLDKLTYAGNLENIKDIEHEPNYFFIKGDITDSAFVEKLFSTYQINHVIHLAAESHVDRSIVSPMDFIQTNIIGTVTLLNAVRKFWLNQTFTSSLNQDSRLATHDFLFYHISTDEVFGSLQQDGKFTEHTPYDPKSPYSASKAASDHFVRAYARTYGLPAIVSNCSNNYGPFQFPEKLIPLAINNIRNRKPVPVYGKGENVRDWLYVEDHAAAIDLIFHEGKTGETYNIGSNNEWRNLDLIQLLCDKMDEKLHREKGESQKLITFVTDRAGHDLRYAIDSSKIRNELKWKPTISFEEGLSKTTDWYLQNEEWLNHVTSGAYQNYYETQYKAGVS